jgi:hypothetical protein
MKDRARIATAGPGSGRHHQLHIRFPRSSGRSSSGSRARDSRRRRRRSGIPWRVGLRVKHRALCQGCLDTLFGRHACQPVSAGAGGERPQQNTRPILEQVIVGIGHQRDVLAGEAVAAIDVVVGFPEAARHLRADLDRML